MDNERILGLIARLNAACPNCVFPELCNWKGAEADAADLPDHLVYSRCKVRKNEVLFRSGDRFEGLYAVQAGFLATQTLSSHDLPQIVGFHLSGDVVGLDGIGPGVHGCEAVALEDSEVCQFPRARVESMSRAGGDLAQRLAKVMGVEIARDKRLVSLLGSEDAETRVAAFLVDMAQRLAARGYSPQVFDLPMSRQQIASYLGLTIETVSRRLTRLKEAGVIATSQRHVRILDVAGLEARL